MADWHSSNEWHKARAYAKTILEPVCVICGKELEGADWTIDHIIPPGEGIPNHDIANLQSLCRQCNGRKADRTLVRTAWRGSRW